MTVCAYLLRITHLPAATGLSRSRLRESPACRFLSSRSLGQTSTRSAARSHFRPAYRSRFRVPYVVGYSHVTDFDTPGCGNLHVVMTNSISFVLGFTGCNDEHARYLESLRRGPHGAERLREAGLFTERRNAACRASTLWMLSAGGTNFAGSMDGAAPAHAETPTSSSPGRRTQLRYSGHSRVGSDQVPHERLVDTSPESEADMRSAAIRCCVRTDARVSTEASSISRIPVR